MSVNLVSFLIKFVIIIVGKCDELRKVLSNCKKWEWCLEWSMFVFSRE